MSSYSRRGLSPFGGRSPYTASSGHSQVRESDFEYIDPGEFATPAADDENAPDEIILRHLNKKPYRLCFKAYAISDGLVTVGDIRYFGAEKIGPVDPRRVTLLYKGRELKDDDRPAKDEGLKQRSEITVVVSESFRRERGSRSDSDKEEAAHIPSGSRAVRRRPSAERKAGTARDSTSSSQGGSNASAPSPPRASSPQEPKTARQKVDHLASLYSSHWEPQCRKYLTHPPSDPKNKDMEHKRLTESIMAQILIKADEIEMQGDEQARLDRRKLLNEAQDMLRKLDATVGKKN